MNAETDLEELARIAAEAEDQEPAKAAPEPEEVAGGEYIPGGEPDDIQDKIATSLAFGFATAFRVLAPGWAVTDPEILQLAEAWAPVLRKYSGNRLSNIPIELKAAIATGEVMAGHLGEPLKPEPAAQPADQSRGGVDDFAETAGG